jgi:hypothetical protein
MTLPQRCCDNPHPWPDAEGYDCGGCGASWWANHNRQPVLMPSLVREAIDRFGYRVDTSDGWLRQTDAPYVSLSIWGPRGGFRGTYEFVDLDEAERLRDKLTFSINHARWQEAYVQRHHELHNQGVREVLDWTA